MTKQELIDYAITVPLCFSDVELMHNCLPSEFQVKERFEDLITTSLKNAVDPWAIINTINHNYIFKK